MKLFIVESPGKVKTQEGKVVPKKTRPPARFTEAALVRELEKRGIGRPSTYAAILQNIIQTHRYLQVDRKRFQMSGVRQAACPPLQESLQRTEGLQLLGLLGLERRLQGHLCR